VISQTTINPLGVYLQETGRKVRKVEPYDLFEEKTSLSPDTTNTLIDETAGADQVLLVFSYSIESIEDVNIVVTANNEDKYTSTDKHHEFSEPILVLPQKALEIKESHSNKTVPMKIKVKCVKYYLSPGGS